MFGRQAATLAASMLKIDFLADITSTNMSSLPCLSCMGSSQGRATGCVFGRRLNQCTKHFLQCHERGAFPWLSHLLTVSIIQAQLQVHSEPFSRRGKLYQVLSGPLSRQAVPPNPNHCNHCLIESIRRVAVAEPRHQTPSIGAVIQPNEPSREPSIQFYTPFCSSRRAASPNS